jgi:hypothetical protein
VGIEQVTHVKATLDLQLEIGLVALIWVNSIFRKWMNKFIVHKVFLVPAYNYVPPIETYNFKTTVLKKMKLQLSLNYQLGGSQW